MREAIQKSGGPFLTHLGQVFTAVGPEVRHDQRVRVGNLRNRRLIITGC